MSFSKSVEVLADNRFLFSADQRAMLATHTHTHIYIYIYITCNIGTRDLDDMAVYSYI